MCKMCKCVRIGKGAYVAYMPFPNQVEKTIHTINIKHQECQVYCAVEVTAAAMTIARFKYDHQK